MAFSMSSAPAPPAPIAAHRFGVFFLGGIGLAHPMDFRFQRVLGFNLQLLNSIEPEQGRVDPNDPAGISLRTGNLILERAAPPFSSLTLEVQQALQNKNIIQRNVLLSVMDPQGLPTLSWLFSDAFPVGYEIIGLDADSDGALIERIELQYASVRPFSL